jgi:hypothetical protein
MRAPLWSQRQPEAVSSMAVGIYIVLLLNLFADLPVEFIDRSN